MQRLRRVAGEVDLHLRLLERCLDVRPQTDRAGGALADEHATALPGHDQLLVAQDPQRLLDRHPGHAVPLRQIGLDGSRSPGASLRVRIAARSTFAT